MSIINLADEPRLLRPLAGWHHTQWADLNPGLSLEGRIANMQDFLKGRAIPVTFVYKVGDQPAGSAALVENDMDTHPELRPWLASVYVAPDYRRRGIASALILHAMAAARDQGFEYLYLFTPNQQRLYQRFGWEVLSQEIYRGQPVTVMRAWL